jgi:hypothetical protein
MVASGQDARIGATISPRRPRPNARLSRFVDQGRSRADVQVFDQRAPALALGRERASLASVVRGAIRLRRRQPVDEWHWSRSPTHRCLSVTIRVARKRAFPSTDIRSTRVTEFGRVERGRRLPHRLDRVHRTRPPLRREEMIRSLPQRRDVGRTRDRAPTPRETRRGTTGAASFARHACVVGERAWLAGAS